MENVDIDKLVDLTNKVSKMDNDSFDDMSSFSDDFEKTLEQIDGYNDKQKESIALTKELKKEYAEIDEMFKKQAEDRERRLAEWESIHKKVKDSFEDDDFKFDNSNWSSFDSDDSFETFKVNLDEAKEKVKETKDEINSLSESIKPVETSSSTIDNIVISSVNTYKTQIAEIESILKELDRLSPTDSEDLDNVADSFDKIEKSIQSLLKVLPDLNRQYSELAASYKKLNESDKDVIIENLKLSEQKLIVEKENLLKSKEYVQGAIALKKLEISESKKASKEINNSLESTTEFTGEVIDTFGDLLRSAEQATGPIQTLPKLTEEQSAAWDEYNRTTRDSIDSTNRLKKSQDNLYNDTESNIILFGKLVVASNKLKEKYESASISLDTYNKKMLIIQERMDSLNLSLDAQAKAVENVENAASGIDIKNTIVRPTNEFNQASSVARNELSSIVGLLRGSNPIVADLLVNVRRAVPLIKNVTVAIKATGSAMASITSIVGVVSIAVTAIIKSLISWKKKQDELTKSLKDTKREISEILGLQKQQRTEDFIGMFDQAADAFNIISYIDKIASQVNSGTISPDKARGLLNKFIESSTYSEIKTRTGTTESGSQFTYQVKKEKKLTDDMRAFIVSYLSDAIKLKGGESGSTSIDKSKISVSESLYEDWVKSTNAVSSLNEQIKTLNEEYAAGAYSSKEYKDKLNDLNSELDKQKKIADAINDPARKSKTGDLLPSISNPLTGNGLDLSSPAIYDPILQKYSDSVIERARIFGNKYQAIYMEVTNRGIDLVKSGALQEIELVRWREEEINKIVSDSYTSQGKLADQAKKVRFNSWSEMLDDASNMISTLNDYFNSSLETEVSNGKISDKEYNRRKKTIQVFSVAAIAAQAASGIMDVWKSHSSERAGNAAIYAKEAALPIPGAAAEAKAALIARNSSALKTAIAQTALISATAGTSIASVFSGKLSSSAPSSSATDSAIGTTTTYTVNSAADAEKITNAINTGTSKAADSKVVLVVEDLNKVTDNMTRASVESSF